MPLFAEGSYDSFEEVVRAVDTLVMRGHSKADMKLAGNSSALETVDKSAGITTVDHSNVSDKEVSSLLNDYRSELDEGQLVLLVDEDKDQGEEQSVDTHPGDAERSNERSAEGPATSTDTTDEAEMIDDVKNSPTDPSGGGSNDDVGLSSDLNASGDDPAGGNGLNQSI
ncbi:hypothetical protein [Alkalibacterium pelagium]|jgi:hypothetical protein|uniref:Heat induced stress protein YflT n=1 Tax=Alkalibacterium pelagium TaxID=426702 RepID=A0A1H7LD54_9LACT|nr:hypothetical protein [Alkalibacterium pelagium]SEK96720.1 hypothetical protein SAMN04488099_10943 [Alkalibacterium pelagium]